MAYVYILKSKKNGDYYIGSTDNFEQRMKQHRRGSVRTTRRLLPVEVMFRQECDNVQLAKKVERKMKSFKRRDYIENMISDGHIKILER